MLNINNKSQFIDNLINKLVENSFDSCEVFISIQEAIC